MALREHNLVRHAGRKPHPAYSCTARKDEAQFFRTKLIFKENNCALHLYESIIPHGLWDE
jgi:hypothetical protein